MAASTSSAVSLSPPSTLADGKAPRQPAPRVAIPTLPAPSPGPQGRSSWKTTVFCRRIARNVMAMGTGESQVMAAATADAPTDTTTELSEIVKTAKETWDKIEDKYAVTSLAVAGVVAVWGSAGMISAIERLPVIPGVLEIVGIGYTGWFAYKNLIFKPDREAFLQKVKEAYNEIIGSS